MLSLPPDWDYSIAWLVAINKENEFAIKTALKELKKFGYLETVKINSNKGNNGKYSYVYNIYEIPRK